jgi:hypothetical protein
LASNPAHHGRGWQVHLRNSQPLVRSAPPLSMQRESR